MTATQSFLANPSYGYDFVVATTQESINSTLRQYVNEVEQPLVSVCYVAGTGGAPQQIGLAELLSLSHGSNPFEVSADADPRTDPDLFNLAKAGFMAGFQAQIGLPGPPPWPDVVALGPTANSVTYSLLCSQFLVTELGAGGSSWTSVSQADGTTPWVFTAAVDLRLADVPGDAYHTLPDPVKQQIKNLSGSAFSIQQLLFDLDNATLLSVPQMSGVPAGVDKLLTTYFIDAYFAQLQASGEPLLGCMVTQPTGSASMLEPTDLTIGVSPYIGAPAEPDLSCLTYLCATGGHTLPAAAPFAWNWLDAAEASGLDGVVAINRTRLVELLIKQMLPMVKANCYQPSVRVTAGWLGEPSYDIKTIGGQTPVIDTSCADEVIVDYNPKRPPRFSILRFSYDAKAHDEAGPGGATGSASMDSHYLCNVVTSGNTLTITQGLKINLSVTTLGATATGIPINVTRMDVCTLSVDEWGNLIADMSTPLPPRNQASEQDVDAFTDFWVGVNKQYGNAAAMVQRVSGTLVNAIPFSALQCFVFPGGQTFSYKNVTFSQHGDLVSRVIYADPGQAPPGPVTPAGQVIDGYQLRAGQWIPNDGYLISLNRKYAAYLQDDGNFVLLHCTGGQPDLTKPYWSWAASKPSLKVGNFTGTPCYATMQADGNFVLYNGRGPLKPGPPYWATGTAQDILGSFLAIMQDNGEFVVYSATPDGVTGDVKFTTNTKF